MGLDPYPDLKSATKPPKTLKSQVLSFEELEVSTSVPEP
jgi:hypothetical protein